MKWNQLFDKLKHFLLYEIDINLKTTETLFKIFFETISETNYKRFQTNIDYLNQFLNKLIIIKSTVSNIVKDNLINELNLIKGLNNEKPK